MTSKTMPDVIYLQPNAGLDGETTWCDGSQFDDDVEYVRADLATNGHFKVLSDVGAERNRQIKKGYDAAHDDRDIEGNHARAAAYYAAAGYAQRSMKVQAGDAELFANAVSSGYPWPEDTKAVEASPRDNLVKAAALIIAEIERIDREEKC